MVKKTFRSWIVSWNCDSIQIPGRQMIFKMQVFQKLFWIIHSIDPPKTSLKIANCINGCIQWLQPGPSPFQNELRCSKDMWKPLLVWTWWRFPQIRESILVWEEVQIRYNLWTVEPWTSQHIVYRRLHTQPITAKRLTVKLFTISQVIWPVYMQEWSQRVSRRCRQTLTYMSRSGWL